MPRSDIDRLLGVAGLDGAVVSRFLLGECERVCLASAKGKVAELRSLLRFLHVRGFTPRSLADRLHQVIAATPNGTQTWTYGYNYTPPPPPQGQPAVPMVLSSSTITNPNGITETTKLTNGQLTDLNYTGTRGTLNDFSYNYNIPGGSQLSDLIQSRTTQDGQTTSYGYDTFNRLASAVQAGGAQPANYQYAYDGAGNRASKTVNGRPTTFAYNVANELTSATLQGQAPRTFTYDASGDQATDSTGYTSSYDQLDQTTGFSGLLLSPLTPTYRGAGQANRTTVTGGGGLLGVKTYDSSIGTTSINNTSLAGIPGDDNTTEGQTQIIRDPAGGLLGVSITPALLGTTTNYTYAVDAQGSVSAVYGPAPSQTPGVTYAYDPDGATTTSGTIVQPMRFQGQYQDSTGLYHMGQRYYDGSTGRWLQPDPAGQVADPSEANAYGFVGGDPINATDPSGLCAFDRGLRAPVVIRGKFTYFRLCGTRGKHAGRTVGFIRVPTSEADQGTYAASVGGGLTACEVISGGAAGLAVHFNSRWLIASLLGFPEVAGPLKMMGIGFAGASSLLDIAHVVTNC